MALTGKQLEELMTSIKKTGSEQLPSLTKSVDSKANTVKSLTKQAANLSTRLESVGVDAKKTTETRNPLEQILNLRPDQNFLLDVLELINRPQQALFGAMEAAATGQDVGARAWEGFSGQRQTQFKDVLKSATGSELGDVQGQFDIVDLVGLAGDIFLDPADLGLLLVSGGTSLVGQISAEGIDAMKIAGATTDAAKVAEVAGTAEDIAQAASKSSDILGKVQDIMFGKGKRLATNIKPEDYIKAVVSKSKRAELGLESASLTNMTMKTIGGGFKGITQFTDASITNGFKMMDETGNLSQSYASLKKGFEYIKNQGGQGIKRAVGWSKEKYNTVMLKFKGIDTRFIDALKKHAADNGMDFGDLNVKAFDAFERMYSDNLLDPEAFIKMATEGKLPFAFSQDFLDDIVEMFGEENIMPYITRRTYDGVEVIEFNSSFKAYNEYNAEFIDMLYSKAKTPRPIFDAQTKYAYEKTLRSSNPELYEVYTKKVQNYEAEIGARTNQRFLKENGYEYVEGKASKKQWEAIKKTIEAEDLKLGRHPQTMLQSKMVIGDRFKKWLTDDERKLAKEAMSPEQLAKYKERVAYKTKALKAMALDKKTYAIELEKILIEEDKALRKFATENVEYTKQLTSAYRKGKIRMARFTDKAHEKYIKGLLKDKVVTEAADMFKQALQEAQRAVGMEEFSDVEALLKMSFDGYATHGLSESVKDAMVKLKQKYPSEAEKVDFTVFVPGRFKAISARETYGTAAEVNKLTKSFYSEMFKDSDWVAKQYGDASPEFIKDMEEFFQNDMLARTSTASLFSFMDDSYSAINYNNRTTKMLLSMSLGNPKAEGSAFKNLSSSETVPTGFEKMTIDDVNRTVKTLEETVKYGGESKEIRDIIDDLNDSLGSKRMPVMESHIYKMIKGSKAVDPKNAIKLLDMINNGFKVGKTTSIAFNVKNVASNMLNQWLAGVPITAMPAYWNRTVKMLSEMDAIDKKLIEGGMDVLSEAELETYKIYQEFLDAGFMSRASVYHLMDLDPEKRWSQPTDEIKAWWTNMTDNPVTRANMDLNLKVDRMSRLSLYLYAKDNPEFLAKLGVDPSGADAAMKAVRMVHFDPNDLTFFEDDVMKRLVPFYTFTRQNLAFQLKNITRHSEKYNRLFKAYNSWTNSVMGLSEEDMQTYQREQMYLPVWKKANGEYVVVKTSLPITALTEIGFGPQELARDIVSKTTPAIRGLFEFATGVQTFTGQPIERYKGELSTRIPLPYFTKSMEWVLSQSGLDVPLAAVAQTGKAVADIAGGESPEQAVFKATNLLGTINPQDAQLTRLYNQIDLLKAKSDVLKSQGVELPTLDEISANATDDLIKQKMSTLQNISDMVNNIKR